MVQQHLLPDVVECPYVFSVGWARRRVRVQNGVVEQTPGRHVCAATQSVIVGLLNNAELVNCLGRRLAR